MNEFVITLSRPETGTWTVGGYWGSVITAGLNPDYPGLDNCFAKLRSGITAYLSRAHPTMKSAIFLVFDPTMQNPYGPTDHRGHRLCRFDLRDGELSLLVDRHG